jgi:hypothetical protein
MSSLSRQGQYVHVYHAELLATIVGEYCTIPVGGLLLNVGELARLGWWCRVVDSHHGGRIRATFYGPDKKSIISFRAAPFYRGLGLKELCNALTDGVLTVMPQLVKNITPDLELLEFVEANIKRRVRRVAKQPKKEVLEKAIELYGDIA